MKMYYELLKVYMAGRKGQGIIEYALILAFVVAVAAALIDGGSIAEAVKEKFDDVTTSLGGTPAE